MIRFLPLLGMFLAAQLVLVALIAGTALTHPVHRAVVSEVGRPPQDTRRPPGALRKWIKDYRRERRAEIRRRERRRERLREAAAPAPTPSKFGKNPAPVSAVPAPVSSGSVWDRLAVCESSGDWSINNGNGYWGGLQHLPSTWFAYGGGAFDGSGPFPYSREQQIAVAERVQAAQGWAAWPSCSRKLGLR